MKVALLAPSVDYARSYGESAMGRRSPLDRGYGLVPGLTPPMGILYVAASLRREGHQVSFYDLNHWSPAEAITRMREERVEMAGVTSTSYDWPRSKDLIRRIKSELPWAKIFVGGAMPDAWQENCIKEAPEVDFVCTGDGEIVAPRLCAAAGDRRALAAVPGLVWQDAGAIRRNEGNAWTQTLDDYPFPSWDLIDVRHYVPSIGYYRQLPNATVVGSRGCPFRCVFCHTATEQSSKVRFRSAENVVEELQYLIEGRGVRDIIFWDNNITLNQPFIAHICEEILRRNWRITWCGATRATQTDPAVLKLMRRSGCWRLLFGIESGVQKNVDALQRKERVAEIRRKIADCHNAEIEVFGTFIFGIPTETYAEGLQTIRFAIEAGVDYAKFFAMGVHPGTPLYRDWEKYGRLVSFQAAQSQHQVGFVPFTLTQNQIQELLRRAYRSFYLRPGYILRRLWRTRSLEVLRQNLRGFLAFFRSAVDLRSPD